MIRVFLADDHLLMLEGVKRLLESDTDIETIGTARSGRDAVAQVLKLQPDVAILDISMPDMNGVEAARQIRERAPQVRTVVLSMHASPEHVFSAFDAGVVGYLLKDSAAQDLIRAVHAVHAGRRFLTPSVAAIVADRVALRPGTSPLESLSRREREILQLVAEGRTSADIARTLHLSPKTVDTYRSRLMQKLGINDIAGLVKFAIRHGLVGLD